MSRAALAFALLASAFAAHAADAPKPEQVITYRQSLYKVILWNWAPMSEMVKGKRPFGADEFKQRSERLAYLTKLLNEAYAEGSGQAAGIATDALPGIWENRKDFDAKLADLQREAQSLATVGAGGDEAKIKEQFAKTAGACKACHDKYRAD